MKGLRYLISGSVLTCLLLGCWLVHLRSQLKQIEQELQQAQSSQEAANCTGQKSQQALHDADSELATLEHTLSRELEEASSASAGPLRNKASTRQLRAKLKEALQLKSAGRLREALPLLLWVFDTCMKFESRCKIDEYELTIPLCELAKLLPEARQELQTRALSMQQALLRDARYNPEALILINQGLDNSAANLQLYDQLPAQFKRRSTFLIYEYQSFVEDQRYQDVKAVFSYADLNFHLSQNIKIAPRFAKEDADAYPNAMFEKTRCGIEVLAGTQDTEHALELAKHLLEAPLSAAQKERIQKSFTRAGHPELWEQLIKQ